MAKRKERTIVSLIGRTNVGKSSILNLLSGQKDYAIVDEAPGTTADTVTALMEIHDMGPFKILDTAGVDEFSRLGNKKRKKTYEAIEEADLSLLIIDLIQTARKKDISLELKLIDRIRKHKKQGLILYNIFEDNKIPPKTIEKYKQSIDKKLSFRLPSLMLSATNQKYQHKLVSFIKKYYKREHRNIDLLPSVKNKGYVLLIIPMDEETPTLRLLRPQDMAVERLLRNFVIPVLYRMDLKKARSKDKSIVAQEKKRFMDILQHLSSSKENLQLVITDSQAFDIVSNWTPKKFPLTSFSIMMTNYMSFGNFEFLVESVKTADSLKKGDNILIAEACNHNRKCDDIGTVQLPRLLEEKVGGKLNFDFGFGRTFPNELQHYKIIIHCGGCMIDRQKYLRRVLKSKEAGVPFTNYGILLSYLQGKKVLERVIKPFLLKNH